MADGEGGEDAGGDVGAEDGTGADDTVGVTDDVDAGDDEDGEAEQALALVADLVVGAGPITCSSRHFCGTSGSGSEWRACEVTSGKTPRASEG